MSGYEKLDPKRINYLAFEGGGGKGIVYQGVTRALEQVFNERYDPTSETEAQISNAWEGRRLREVEVTAKSRLFYPSKRLEQRQLKGVAGTSAGAITAFCLAIGMSSEDLKFESDRTETLPLGALNPQGALDRARRTLSPLLQQGSVYETFFEDPKSGYFRRVEPVGLEGYHPVRSGLLGGLQAMASGVLPGPNNALAILPKVLTDPQSIASMRISGTERDLDHPMRFYSYVHSLLFDRGLLPGNTAREYFAKLLEDYLLKKQRSIYGDRTLLQGVLAKKGGEITFHDLFNLTGVDLVINCTNISAHDGRLFSVGHTPAFPVVDAVLASMSLPLMFKPLLVNTNVEFEEADDDYTRGYRGLYLDGGMTLNYPLHVFDRLRPFTQRATDTGGAYPLLFKGEVVALGSDLVSVRRAQFEETPPFSGRTAGFRLGSSGPYRYDRSRDFGDGSDPALLTLLDDLISTMMFTGASGQVRTSEEARCTLYIDPGKLEVADFSTPRVDRMRGKEEKAKATEALIRKAEQTTRDRFQ